MTGTLALGLTALVGDLLWLLAVGVIVPIFPRQAYEKDQPSRLVRGSARPGLLRKRYERRLRRLGECVTGPGLSPAAWERVKVLEARDQFVDHRWGAGMVLLMIAGFLPILALFFGQLVFSEIFATADSTQGYLVITAASVFIPLFLPLVFFLISVRRGYDAIIPTEAHVWRRFRQLFLDESENDCSWRWRAERRVDNVTRLIAVLTLDLDRFRPLGTVATSSTTWAQEVGAALLGPSGSTLPNPARVLRLSVARQALDAWVLGEWERLPGDEVDPAVFTGRGERSIPWRGVLIIAMVGLVGVAIARTLIFPDDGATAIINSVAVLIAGTLLVPLGEVLKRWGRSREDAAPRRRTPPPES